MLPPKPGGVGQMLMSGQRTASELKNALPTYSGRPDKFSATIVRAAKLLDQAGYGAAEYVGYFAEDCTHWKDGETLRKVTRDGMLHEEPISQDDQPDHAHNMQQIHLLIARLAQRGEAVSLSAQEIAGETEEDTFRKLAAALRAL